MIKIEKTETFGWEAAIRGMRNPMNSWDKSDSYDGCLDEDMFKIFQDNGDIPKDAVYQEDFIKNGNTFVIGENDLALMKKLAKAGTDHRKFLRMITVYCDITAPLYWWKEFDTYKVGTVANSCSTMHKIHAKRFHVDDFSHDFIWAGVDHKEIVTQLVNTEDNPVFLSDDEILIYTVSMLNELRELYLKTKDKRYWYKMIQLLPSSYNQKRTVMTNYEVLANIYPSRKNHKLLDWHDFCTWILGLPYSKLITGDNKW